jgi:zinc protease
MHSVNCSIKRYAVLPLLLALIMIGAGSTLAADLVPFEQYTMNNGMTVILHQDHSTPVAALVMMYHVGSKNEKPGRTGFAHLFEHVMFKGSAHVADGEHFKLLQEIGANINGSTSQDRTNYFEVVPSNYLELAIYLESDRMGFLLDAVNQAKLDNQRDVVKNERRQRVDNQPYGQAEEKILKALYPPDHPYSWSVIGSMEDLSAAALEDVKGFFRTYYAPNNACLVIAGNFDPKLAREWIEKYFGSFPRGNAFERPKPVPVALVADNRMVYEDKVQLPRLYLTWPSARGNTREDAVLSVLSDILTSGKNSRLYKSLVYEKQTAQSVRCSQDGSEIAGQLEIQVTAKPGKTLAEMETSVNEEITKLLKDGVTPREIETSVNNTESQLINGVTTAFGKANSLATYFTLTGDAGNLNRELERYKGITPEEVVKQAKMVLSSHKVVLSIVPEGKTDLSAEAKAAPGKEMPK